MHPSPSLFLTVSAALSLALAPVAELRAAPKNSSPTKPNLVVILADDLGWNDISLHGGQTPTPNIDRLAASGLEFKNLVVNSVCSPTRASFYTGCEAVRHGYGGEVGDRMNPNLRTIAHTFKAAGYSTGLFGKWHNGRSPIDKRPQSAWTPTPMQAGFDSFEGFYGGGTDFFTQRPHAPQGNPPRNWFVNDQHIGEGEGFTTDLISGGAIKFIEANAGKPFFCMVAHAAPHEPFQATDALLKRVPASIRGDVQLTEAIVRDRNEEFSRTRKADKNTWEYGGFTEAERRVVYSAMLIGLDDGVGQLLETLERTGQDKNTIVMFLSDNGAMHFIREGNLPLRGAKHTLYDGGIHVPGILSFPAGGIAAGAKYEPMIRGTDLYPTLAELAGVPVENPKAIDGVSQLPSILGKAKAPELEWNGIFVYYGAYRDNQWKLIANAGGSELYDLKKDPSETEDVAGKFPEVVRKLRAKHEAWLKDRGANVNYAPPVVKGPIVAQPDGEALEVQVSAPAKRQKLQLEVSLQRPARMKAHNLTNEDYACTPGDCLVYDMKLESMVPGQSAYLSPTRGEPIYGGTTNCGVDASGTLVTRTDKLPAPLNEWKRYVLGLGNSAAHDLSELRLVVESAVAGDIRLLVDNIHILKPDGRIVPVWDGGKAPVSKSALKVAVRPDAKTATK